MNYIRQGLKIVIIILLLVILLKLNINASAAVVGVVNKARGNNETIIFSIYPYVYNGSDKQQTIEISIFKSQNIEGPDRIMIKFNSNFNSSSLIINTSILIDNKSQVQGSWSYTTGKYDNGTAYIEVYRGSNQPVFQVTWIMVIRFSTTVTNPGHYPIQITAYKADQNGQYIKIDDGFLYVIVDTAPPKASLTFPSKCIDGKYHIGLADSSTVGYNYTFQFDIKDPIGNGQDYTDPEETILMPNITNVHVSISSSVTSVTSTNGKATPTNNGITKYSLTVYITNEPQDGDIITIEFDVTDSAGHTTHYKQNITVDLQGPELKLKTMYVTSNSLKKNVSLPTNPSGYYVINKTLGDDENAKLIIIVTSTNSDLSTIEYTYGYNLQKTGKANLTREGGEYIATIVIPIKDLLWNVPDANRTFLGVTAYDCIGNAGTHFSFTFFLDLIAPSINAEIYNGSYPVELNTDPSHPTYICLKKHNSTLVLINVTDLENEFKYVTFWLFYYKHIGDSNYTIIYKNNTTTTTFELPISFLLFRSGYYKLIVKSVDYGFNVNNTTYYILIDKNSPEVKIINFSGYYMSETTIPPTYYVKSTVISLVFKLTDEFRVGYAVQLIRSSTTITIASGTSSKGVDQINLTNINISSVPDGKYTLQVVSTDNCGHQNKTVVGYIMLNKTSLSEGSMVNPASSSQTTATTQVKAASGYGWQKTILIIIVIIASIGFLIKLRKKA